MSSGRHQSVGGQYARRAAIGQDRQSITNLLPRQRQCLGGAEQFRHCAHPQHPASAKRRFVDGVGEGVRSGGADTCIGAPRLQYQDRFNARGRSGRRHEFTTIRDAFEIQQDGSRMLIRGEMVKHIAKIDIRHFAQ